MRTTLTYKNWNTEEENLLTSMVGKISFREMTEHFPGRTEASLLKKSIKLGLSSNYKSFKYTVNQDYWAEIDLTKAYFGGFIAADGNLNSTKYQLNIQLNPKDVSILNNFKEATEFTGPINIYKRKKYKSDETKDVCSISINRIEKWYHDLKRHFNIEPIKSKRLPPPNLTNSYLKYAYILGLVDGDGWISMVNNKNKKKLILGFVGSSLQMVSWVKDILEKFHGKKTVKLMFSSKNCFYFVLHGKKAAVLIDYLRQLPIPKFERKWDNQLVLDYIATQKQKYPHLFKTLNQEDIKNLLPKSDNNISQPSPISV